LAKQFNIGRNSVRKIIRKNQVQRDKGHDLLPKKTNRKAKKKKLDPFIPKMKELLEKYSNITGVRMFEELKKVGYDGGISTVRGRLRLMRPTPKKAPTMRFETKVALQAQMDWSPYKINFTEEGKKEVLCFSYILGYSRRHYIDFTLDRKFHTMIRRHQDAFEYFGGVPLQCLYDGEKTVLLRWEAGRPVFNPSFIAFITHYHVKPIAVRKAQTKGKVEAPFQYVEGNLLNAREFRNFSDLREITKWWLKEKSDKHIHDTTKRSPLELFLEEEKDALQPLPCHPYDTSEVKLLIANCNGFVEFGTNTYSVPYEFVADILTLKATEHEIFIYSPEIELIATHERIPTGSNKHSEKPEHRTSKKIRYGLEPVKESFLSLGNAANTFLEGLKDKYPRNCGFHARAILRMKEKYHAMDINKALKHANRYQAFDGKAIERILLIKAKTRTLESIRNDRAREKLEKALPKVRQRALDDYSDLLSNEEEEANGEKSKQDSDANYESFENTKTS